MSSRSLSGRAARTAKAQRRRLAKRYLRALQEGRLAEALEIRNVLAAAVRRHGARGLLAPAASLRRAGEIQGGVLDRKADIPFTKHVEHQVQNNDFLESLISRGVLGTNQAQFLSLWNIASPSDLFARALLVPTVRRCIDSVPLAEKKLKKMYPEEFSSARETGKVLSERKRGIAFGLRIDTNSIEGLRRRAANWIRGESNNTIPTVVSGKDRWVSTAEVLSNWPVTDQGTRPTCMSHAATFCIEHISGYTCPLSPQYVHWAVKRSEATSEESGCDLEDVKDALAKHGICKEIDWPYVLEPQEGNPSQENVPTIPSPSPGAIADAKTRCQHRVRELLRGDECTAQALYDLLEYGPVILGIPIYRASKRSPSNWDDPALGKVTDPEHHMSNYEGEAHAVCIVGFKESPAEPGGGVFIVRNSWGTGWGTQLPHQSRIAWGPAPGYGQISALHVDRKAILLGQLEI